MIPPPDNPFGYRFFEDGGFPDHYRGCLFKTDFRVWIRYGWLMPNPEISPEEKGRMAVRLCYREIPEGTPPETLVEGLSWFAQAGESDRTDLLKLPQRLLDDIADMNNSRDPESPRQFDIFWDFKEVWASFMAEYQIDLYRVIDLHWWGYLALLAGLGPESPLARRLDLRATNPKDKPGKERLINSKLAALPAKYF